MEYIQKQLAQKQLAEEHILHLVLKMQNWSLTSHVIGGYKSEYQGIQFHVFPNIINVIDGLDMYTVDLNQHNTEIYEHVKDRYSKELELESRQQEEKFLTRLLEIK